MQTTLVGLLLFFGLNASPVQDTHDAGLFLTIDARVSAQPQDGLFPIPTSGLAVVEDSSEGLALLAVLREFSKVTGQTLVLSDFVKQQLSQTPTGILGQVEVPPDQVYTFVESLLVYNGFVMTRLKAGSVPLIGIYSTNSNSNFHTFKRSWLNVSAGDIGQFMAHPALLVQTIVDVSPMDARAAVNGLRGMIWDSNTQAILPTGTQSSLILRGTGSEVASWVRLLEQSRVFEREDLERRAEEAARRQKVEAEAAGESEAGER